MNDSIEILNYSKEETVNQSELGNLRDNQYKL